MRVADPRLGGRRRRQRRGRFESFADEGQKADPEVRCAKSVVLARNCVVYPVSGSTVRVGGNRSGHGSSSPETRAWRYRDRGYHSHENRNTTVMARARMYVTHRVCSVCAHTRALGRVVVEKPSAIKLFCSLFSPLSARMQWTYNNVRVTPLRPRDRRVRQRSFRRAGRSSAAAVFISTAVDSSVFLARRSRSIDSRTVDGPDATDRSPGPAVDDAEFLSVSSNKTVWRFFRLPFIPGPSAHVR